MDRGRPGRRAAAGRRRGSCPRPRPRSRTSASTSPACRASSSRWSPTPSCARSSPSCPSAGTTRCWTASGSPRARRRWRRSATSSTASGSLTATPEVRRRVGRYEQPSLSMAAVVDVAHRCDVAVVENAAGEVGLRLCRRCHPDLEPELAPLGLVTRTFDSWWVSIHGDGGLRALLEARPELQGGHDVLPALDAAADAGGRRRRARGAVGRRGGPRRGRGPDRAAAPVPGRGRRLRAARPPHVPLRRARPGQDDPGAGDARGRRRLPGAHRRARVAAPELAARGRALAAAPHARRAVRRRRGRRSATSRWPATRSPTPWSTARSPRRRARSSSTSRTSARTRRRAARRPSPRSPTRCPRTRSSCCSPARRCSTAPRSSRRS